MDLREITPAGILARLDADFPDLGNEDSQFFGWDNVLFDLIEGGAAMYNKDAVRAFLIYIEMSCVAPTIDADDFRQEFEERYRGYWSSAGKFAREYVIDDWATQGDSPSGRFEALEEFGDFIDWDSYADSPMITGDWCLVTLPDGSGVHVFKED